ncbi:MAG: CoA transferase [Frankiales bacterium]|nr:CoA transferase [Frankiales bacterium]
MTELSTALAAGPGWPRTEDGDGPLAGVRVLDLSRVLAGPYCCTVLADLGADVLKVERPGAGDDTRHWGPPWHGEDAAYFFSVNRDRRSVALDMTTRSGREVVARLVGAADVVVENFLPHHLTALGLETLRDSARAVWVSVRGAGGDGPDAARPGYDVMAQARGGLMSVTGTDVPTKVGVAVVDVVTGLYAAVGAVAGLVGRQPAAPRGRRVEVGLLETAVAMMVNQASNALIGGTVPGPTGNDHPNVVPYGPVACSDAPLVLGAGNDGQFRALCAAIGLDPDPAWATNGGRLADRARLKATLESVLRTRTAGEWAAVLTAAGVPCAPVQDLAAVELDAQIQAVGLVQEVDHPAGRVKVVGSPYRLDGIRPRVRRAPPLLGQHTVEVLTDLGLSERLVQEVLGAHRG